MVKNEKEAGVSSEPPVSDHLSTLKKKKKDKLLPDVKSENTDGPTNAL